MRQRWAIGLGVLAVMAGCGGDRPVSVFRGLVPPDPRVAGAATPDALLARVRSAFDDGDRNSFAACYARADRRQSQGAALALAVFDAGRAALELRDAADRRFGPAAVDPMLGRLRLPARTVTLPQMRDLVGTGPVTMAGDDRATVAVPDHPGATSQLVRLNGAWLFDASPTVIDLHLDDRQVENVIAMASALARWHHDCVPLADTAAGPDAFVAECERRKQAYLEAVRQ